MAPDAPRLIQLIRRHWGIDNNPYSVLDVAFAKHKTCKRAGNAAQDFSLLYRIAPIPLKQKPSQAAARESTSKPSGIRLTC